MIHNFITRCVVKEKEYIIIVTIRGEKFAIYFYTENAWKQRSDSRNLTASKVPNRVGQQTAD